MPQNKTIQRKKPNKGGDVIRRPDQVLKMLEYYRTKCDGSSNKSKRKNKRQADEILNQESGRWKLPIVYAFEDGGTEEWKDVIHDGIRLIERSTCIWFDHDESLDGFAFNWKNTPHMFFVHNHVGCESDIGQIEIKQKVYIGTKEETCAYEGTVAHEIMHALGIHHEQSRTDRDEFVTIHEENIKEEMKENFLMEPTSMNFNLPYDYDSIMHYPPETRPFESPGQYPPIKNDNKWKSKERFYLEFDLSRRHVVGGHAYDILNTSWAVYPHLKTISSKLPLYESIMGHEEYVSYKDAKLLNQLYCNDEMVNYCKNKQPCKNGGYYKRIVFLCYCTCPAEYTGQYCELPKYKNSKCTEELVADKHVQNLHLTVLEGFCHYQIKTAHKYQRLIFRLKYFKVNNARNCIQYCHKSTDYLEIKYRKDKSVSGVKMCCNDRKGFSLLIDYPEPEIIITQSDPYSPFFETSIAFEYYTVDSEPPFIWDLLFFREQYHQTSQCHLLPYTDGDVIGKVFYPSDGSKKWSGASRNCGQNYHIIVNSAYIVSSGSLIVECLENVHTKQSAWYWKKSDGVTVRVYWFHCASPTGAVDVTSSVPYPLDKNAF